MGKIVNDKAWTPAAHFINHTKDISCGCATDLDNQTLFVCTCKAAYVYEEVVTFPIWRCYDCCKLWNISGDPKIEEDVKSFYGNQVKIYSRF